MPRKSRAEKFAGQPVARLADAIDRAITKGALSGDAQMLAGLQREVRALMLGVCEPPPMPKAFRGRKQLVFEAVLQGMTPAEAVEATGCSRATEYRYRKDPEFQAALSDARAHRIVAVQESAGDLLPLALQRMRGILLDPAAAHKDLIAVFRELADRSGLAKTERVEVEEVGDKHAGDVRGSAAEAATRLRVLVGGRAESI